MDTVAASFCFILPFEVVGRPASARWAGAAPLTLASTSGRSLEPTGRLLTKRRATLMEAVVDASDALDVTDGASARIEELSCVTIFIFPPSRLCARACSLLRGSTQPAC